MATCPVHMASAQPFLGEWDEAEWNKSGRPRNKRLVSFYLVFPFIISVWFLNKDWLRRWWVLLCMCFVTAWRVRVGA